MQSLTKIHFQLKRQDPDFTCFMELACTEMLTPLPMNLSVLSGNHYMRVTKDVLGKSQDRCQRVEAIHGLRLYHRTEAIESG